MRLQDLLGYCQRLAVEMARRGLRDKAEVVLMADSKTDGRGALFVTASSEDPRFNQPYVDVRSWRDEPVDAPVFPGAITTQHGGAPVKARHLYVHGGFRGTDAKFSFCFPPEEEYQGRFFQATHQLLAGEEARVAAPIGSDWSISLPKRLSQKEWRSVQRP